MRDKVNELSADANVFALSGDVDSSFAWLPQVILLSTRAGPGDQNSRIIKTFHGAPWVPRTHPVRV